MSALPPKADMRPTVRNVCLVPKADIREQAKKGRRLRNAPSCQRHEHLAKPQGKVPRLHHPYGSICGQSLLHDRHWLARSGGARRKWVRPAILRPLAVWYPKVLHTTMLPLTDGAKQLRDPGAATGDYLASKHNVRRRIT